MRVLLTREEMQAKIINCSVIDPGTGCWVWSKSITSGYGNLFNGVDTVYAHKASFEAFNSSIPSAASNTLVLHKCNKRSCVNPEHLYLGTKKSNTYDALRDGAYPSRRVLSGEERQRIKDLHHQGYSMRNIAKMFNSNHPQISRAIKENEYAFS